MRACDDLVCDHASHTYVNTTQHATSRIDHFFITNQLRSSIISTHVIDSVINLSVHRLISMCLDLTGLQPLPAGHYVTMYQNLLIDSSKFDGIKCKVMDHSMYSIIQLVTICLILSSMVHTFIVLMLAAVILHNNIVRLLMITTSKLYMLCSVLNELVIKEYLNVL